LFSLLEALMTRIACIGVFGVSKIETAALLPSHIVGTAPRDIQQLDGRIIQRRRTDSLPQLYRLIYNYSKLLNFLSLRA
jgi:hypothetical protein